MHQCENLVFETCSIPHSGTGELRLPVVLSAVQCSREAEPVAKEMVGYLQSLDNTRYDGAAIVTTRAVQALDEFVLGMSPYLPPGHRPVVAVFTRQLVVASCRVNATTILWLEGPKKFRMSRLGVLSNNFDFLPTLSYRLVAVYGAWTRAHVKPFINCYCVSNAVNLRLHRRSPGPEPHSSPVVLNFS